MSSFEPERSEGLAEEAVEGADVVADLESGHAAVVPDEPVRTGDPLVDAVLESVEGLSERPVDEHVEVFEQAHERLRRALDPSD